MLLDPLTVIILTRVYAARSSLSSVTCGVKPRHCLPSAYTCVSEVLAILTKSHCNALLGAPEPNVVTPLRTFPACLDDLAGVTRSLRCTPYGPVRLCAPMASRLGATVHQVTQVPQHIHLTPQVPRVHENPPNVPATLQISSGAFCTPCPANNILLPSHMRAAQPVHTS